jgi:hypothetical protein
MMPDGESHPRIATRSPLRDSYREYKGKGTASSPEKKHTRNDSSTGLGIGRSLSTNTRAEQGENSSPVGGVFIQGSIQPIGTPETSLKSTLADLDVESAQIVNLALNLSESRRNASRKNILSPQPPTLSGFTDSLAGGSLRQHLQQQRRASRNVSPKSERVDRAFSISQRTLGQRLDSPLQAAFSTRQGSAYQYHFSSSTLARAEKAKRAIELMAQYRRLLHYIPHLKPQDIVRLPTYIPPSTLPGTPSNPSRQLSDENSFVVSTTPLGREYNPLQYIRNRKVRARERKAIDGESQGFSDIEKVTQWVDEVEKTSANKGYQTIDRVSLPPFDMSSKDKWPSYSLPSATSRNQTVYTKSRRPRVDWITDPADMLADIYWLEQSDNKRLIEDNRERKIFPHYDRLAPRQEVKRGSPAEPETRLDGSDRVLHLNTEFNSIRSNLDPHSDISRGRGRHRIHESHHLLDDIKTNFPRSHQRSSSELSEDEYLIPMRSRSATTDTHDLSGNILEKQMMEMLEKETRESTLKPLQDAKRTEIIHLETQKLDDTREATENHGTSLSNGDRTSSIISGKEGRRRHNSLNKSGGSRPPSNRASLEVPEPYGRSSLEGLDSSVPNSPQAKALRAATKEFVPSIAMDLSPTHSRRSSPARKPALAKVRSKINIFHDRSREHSRSQSVSHSLKDHNRDLDDRRQTGGHPLETPITPDQHKRSISPSPIAKSKVDDKLSNWKAGSVRRRAEEIPSGIRGLFKSGRRPVSTVSDLWKKEISPLSAASSSTDESDFEYNKESSVELSEKMVSPKYSRRYDDDLPVFTSPFRPHSRSEAQKGDGSTESPESDHNNQSKRGRRISESRLLQLPRIDVHDASPSPSPELAAANRSSRNSDISDLDDQKNSNVVQGADSSLTTFGIHGHQNHSVGQFIFPLARLVNQDNSRMARKEWSFSDSRGTPIAKGQITKRDIATMKALLLSSGIKAREITRRAAELQNLRSADCDPNSPFAYTQIATLNKEPQLIRPVPRSQEHVLAAQILSKDIQFSSQMWQASAESFSTETVEGLLTKVEALQDRITGRNGLSVISRAAEQEADEVSRDLVTGQTLKVKGLIEKMETLQRRRRRRLRWLRRAGWVGVEWVLVGVLWWVWMVVMLIRVVQGVIVGVVSGVRWLFWL